jgi:hypothetical protein
LDPARKDPVISASSSMDLCEFFPENSVLITMNKIEIDADRDKNRQGFDYLKRGK